MRGILLLHMSCEVSIGACSRVRSPTRSLVIPLDVSGVSYLDSQRALVDPSSRFQEISIYIVISSSINLNELKNGRLRVATPSM